MGAWLKVNGEAIYNTTAFPGQQNYTSSIYFTKSNLTNTGYVILSSGHYPQGEDMLYRGGPVPAAGSKVRCRRAFQNQASFDYLSPQRA